ncbi:MAG: MBL fold metallo-hydrolase [Acidobacteriota bacterium]|nr:MBL fold metallo-hydrolase [Acidobacteriota bacterium]
MTLKFLGTGTSTGVPILACHCPVCTSSDPRDKRTRPSILLEYNGRAVVIDTTPDFRAQALREGMSRLDAVVFTHGHADHIMGLDDTRVFYFRQQVPIPIYAEARCMDTLRSTFKYIFDGNYPFGGVGKLDPHLIDGPFELWDLKLTPVPVIHGKLPIFGYRFHDIAYVTDVSEIPESSIPLLEGLDVLIIDALRPKPHPTHLSVAQALGMVERLKPRRALFTHIAHELGHEATNSTLPSHVQLAYDGLKLEF